MELGGVVVMANADVRRRLGERATGSRLLSAAVAAGATAFNWTAHPDPLLGGFFAGMSALGYLVWLTHTENSRRDRLRALDALPPTTPAYEPFGHWIRHPWLTHRAKSLAKAHPNLGLYESLAAARTELDAERRRRAIATVLHRKIRATVDPTTADIAVAVYDLDEIAGRLANRADYDALTDLIAQGLAPTQLAPSPTQPGQRSTTPVDSHTAQAPDPSLMDAFRHQPVRPSTLAAPPINADARLPQSTIATARSGHCSTPAQRGTVAKPASLPNLAHTAADSGVYAIPTSDVEAGPDEASRMTPTDQQRADPIPSQRHGRPGKAALAERNDQSVFDQGFDQPEAVPLDTAAAVAYWRRREPDLSLAEVAARIGRSKRTVYRHWERTVA
ncbi:hypothetical protein ACFPIJ_42255 [Dactylosporangium cerinum]|uniref:Homeodomain-like domain-containing protein n=2 Tax=Dactylosporangium cerinum TaxID=1434730 RepID=A0ABV9W7H1_9ACTN